MIARTPGAEPVCTWVFVMTLAWSRHQCAELVTDQSVATWLGCHRRAFEWFNGVPATILIDNPKCAITRACYHDPGVQRAYFEAAEAYGLKIAPCPPRDPCKKGRVEAGVKYVKASFFPLREFRDLTDANRQLHAWVLGVAGNRLHGTTRERPLTRFTETQRYLLRELPARAPQLGAWASVTVAKDHHVTYERCRYSVPYTLVGKTLWLRPTDTTVQVCHDHTLAATHSRLTRAGERHTVDDHLPPEALAFKRQDPTWCRRSARSAWPGAAGSCRRGSG